MGIIKEALKSYFFTPTSTPIKEGNDWWYQMVSAYGEQGKYINDFLEVPELNNIINIRAQATADGIMQQISKKTGEDIRSSENIAKLITNPNVFQSRVEFWKQSEIWRSIFANEYLYFNRPFGMPNSYKGMFSLEPARIEIEYKSDAYFLETDLDGAIYTYTTLSGKQIILDKANLIHLSDNRVDSENILLGVSKLKALQPAIKNIRAAYKKRGIVLGLPVGIFSKQLSPIIDGITVQDEIEKKAAKKELLTNGPNPLITNMSLDYSAMNINANQMGLFEEVKEDTGVICDAFGVDYGLLSGAKANAYDNKKEGRKQMYEIAIIPSMAEKVGALNQFIGTDSKSWELKMKWDHLPVFDENKKERAVSLKLTSDSIINLVNAGLMSPEQAKKELSKYNI